MLVIARDCLLFQHATLGNKGDFHFKLLSKSVGAVSSKAVNPVQIYD